jgi:hypothetical protein
MLNGHALPQTQAAGPRAILGLLTGPPLGVTIGERGPRSPLHMHPRLCRDSLRTLSGMFRLPASSDIASRSLYVPLMYPCCRTN